MSDPEIFALNFTAGADLSLLATLTLDGEDASPADFAALWFTIREEWVDEFVPDDTSAIVQLSLASGITAVDATDVRIVVPGSVTALMFKPDYVADLRGKTINGSRVLPLAVGTLTRTQHTTVRRT